MMSGKEAGILRGPLWKLKIPPIPNIDLYSFVLQYLKQHQDKIALIDELTGITITYFELLRKVDVLARHLLKLGFVQGSTMVLLSTNCVEFIIMILATLRLGGIFSCINHLLTQKEIYNLIELCDGEFLFTSGDAELVTKIRSSTENKNHSLRIKKVISRTPVEGFVLFSALMEENAGLPVLQGLEVMASINPQTTPACIMFSSGTTGVSKAVALSHRNIIAAVVLGNPTEITAIKRHTLLYLPLCHIYGLSLVFHGFKEGACTVVMPGFDLGRYLKAVQKYKVEALYLVPPLAVRLAKDPEVAKYDLTSVRTVYCGAAPLSSEIEKEVCVKLKNTGVKFHQTYGMTESVGAMTASYREEFRPSDCPPPPPGCIGFPFPGTQVKIVDIKSGETLGPNQPGEVWMKTPQVMLGYLKNPEATRKTKDEHGWMKSGDIGYYDDSGYLYITDRFKELIKYKGFQVAPAELEAVILSHPAVSDCGVVGQPDEKSGEVPHAWVVLKQGKTASKRDIEMYVADRVAPFKRLRGGVRFVSKIPKTASGKILRRDMKKYILQSKI